MKKLPVKYSLLNNQIIIVALALIFQIVFTKQSLAQEGNSFELESIAENRNSLSIELAGRTFLFASINYEYFLGRQFSLGGGVGVINISTGNITRSNNEIPEEGKYLDISTTQMIYGHYYIGKRKHKAFVTGGLTNFLITNRNKYPSENEFYQEFSLRWNAGIGYQYTRARSFYRLSGYIINMPGDSGWFPEYMPWIGLTAGYRF